MPNKTDNFDQLTQEALSVSELDRCYATLGLNNSASIEQVKERCKELIKQWHPDQFKDDPARHQVAVEKFAAFKKAYDTISFIHLKKPINRQQIYHMTAFLITPVQNVIWSF